MINSIREAALDMARRGFRVLPLQPDSKNVFAVETCEKKYRSLAGGVHRATRDPERINRWFDVNPDINFGVEGAGMVIIDVDVKKGKTGLSDLQALGSLPRTFTVLTYSGGMHLYYSGAEAGQYKPFGDGIDIRSRGGYVVGPGSVINGKRYYICEDSPCAPLPDHLYERLKKVDDPSERTTTAVTELDKPEAIKIASAFLSSEPLVEEGNRNCAAFAVACQVKDFGVSEDTAVELIRAWDARNLPPLGDEIESVVANAFRYGRYAPGVRNAAAEFEDIPDELKETVADLPPAFTFRKIVQGRKPSEIPARPWLVQGLLIKSSLTAIVAQPGARKSTFTIGLAVGFALGDLSFMGFKLSCGPTNVMLINNEDDEDEVCRRIAACCDINGLNFERAMARIFIHGPPDGAPFVGIGRTEKGSIGVHKKFLELKEVMRSESIGLTIFDPLADIHHANENDNSEMAQVMSHLRALVRGEQAAGLIVHHSRKPNNAATTPEAAGDPFTSRGASAIHGNVRVLATLCPASEEDAFSLLGVLPPNHLRYSRFDLGKGSYSEPGKHTKWYECESCRVGPPDGDDTAPALRYVDRKDQVERQVIAIHRAICDGRDLLNSECEMSMADAAGLVEAEMPGIDSDTAMRYLTTLFKTPRSINGVTVSVVKLTSRTLAVRVT